MSPRSASLLIVGIWWSKKTASIPLTITTQMSAARLWQLKALCMQYPGPVSAALYVGVLKGTVLHENGVQGWRAARDEVDMTAILLNKVGHFLVLPETRMVTLILTPLRPYQHHVPAS